jgi:hypothetical protein
MTKRILTAVLTACAALAAVAVTTPAAHADSTTTGAIQGIVKDKTTGEALPGVAVVLTGEQGKTAPSTLTDENGFYKIDGLTPGRYIVKFFFATVTVTRDDVVVGVNKTTPIYITMDTQDAGEKIEITGPPPTIDPTKTTQGITLDQEYTKNIPIPGRSFEAALGAAAGSQNDGLGTSFSGSSSLENQYYVDGINTTGLTFGTVGSPVINDFIQEIEVITGGYDAEYGRATGGVVNVVTKSGTNEVKGSVFAYLTPGATVAAVQRSPSQADAIDATGNLAYNYDFGFEVGGPIIKDKLWYYVGFDPNYVRTDITRRVNSQVDCFKVQPDGSLSGCDAKNNADGKPDRDPRTGFYITTPVEERVIPDTSSVYQALGKINAAISPEHQGQISFFAQPGSRRSAGIFGLPASTTYDVSSLTSDVSGKWTSKFNDNKTEVEAVVGWHRDHVKANLADDAGNLAPEQGLYAGDLSHYVNWGGESPAVKAACSDHTSTDQYPGIDNCPELGYYNVGGAGGLTDNTEQRLSAKLSVTERLKALGTHEIKGGLDTEENYADKLRQYSGGVGILNTVATQVETFRWVQILPPGMTGDHQCASANTGAVGPGGTSSVYQCNFISGDAGAPGTTITGNTMNWAAYLRDSWQIQPNLTLNYGLRYEEERLRFAKELQGKMDPVTGDVRSANAMTLTGMIAPRIGVLYDWTKEGRSKIYGHWGRFYESIPMDINDRSFGGEVSYRQLYDLTKGDCGPVSTMDSSAIGGNNGNECLNSPGSGQLYGAGGTLVAPNIKAQYLDEIIFGVEYELLEDLKIGMSFQDRQLGRVIEDVSTDGANTYIIANPGDFNSADLGPLESRIMNTDDPATKARLMNELKLFQGIGVFDKARRRYDALQFTVTRRFSKSLYLQGSYTYSRTTGNYPGLISYDNGQVDPNISSQFDLIELLANRQGPLPQDRPHYIKIDGYYTFDLHKAGQITVGTRLRALSGIPRNVLGGHYLYGLNESFLLPRGQIGRTDFESGIDLHVGYGRNLGHGVKLELFSDLYNLLDRQGQFYTDDGYAYYGTGNNANPIVGGTYQDLIWIRRVDQNGNDTGQPLLRNKNFGNTTARYAPLSVQFGMRLTF